MNENRLAFLESSIAAIHDAWILKFGMPPDAQSMQSHLAARLQDWDRYVGGTPSPVASVTERQLPIPLPASAAPATSRTFDLAAAIASAEAVIGRPLTEAERAQYAGVSATHSLPAVTPPGV